MRKVIIRNKSSVELGVMIEPWCNRCDVQPGEEASIDGKDWDEDIIVDVFDESFVSVWGPPGSQLSVKK